MIGPLRAFGEALREEGLHRTHGFVSRQDSLCGGEQGLRVSARPPQTLLWTGQAPTQQSQRGPLELSLEPRPLSTLHSGSSHPRVVLVVVVPVSSGRDHPWSEVCLPLITSPDTNMSVPCCLWCTVSVLLHCVCVITPSVCVITPSVCMCVITPMVCVCDHSHSVCDHSYGVCVITSMVCV